MLPDLAREGGDGSFAAGAGDGGDGGGLLGKNFAAASASARRGFGVVTNGTRHPPDRRMIAGNRNRAGGNRRIDEARAVGLGAGQRKEQIARLHGAAIDGKASDLHACACGSIVASSLKRSRSFMSSSPGPRFLILRPYEGYALTHPRSEHSLRRSEHFANVRIDRTTLTI